VALASLPSVSALYDRLYHAHSLVAAAGSFHRLLSNDHAIIRAQGLAQQVFARIGVRPAWASLWTGLMPMAVVYLFSPTVASCTTCPSLVQKWVLYCCSALPFGYWASVWYGGRLMSQAAQEVADLKKSKYKLKGA